VKLRALQWIEMTSHDIENVKLRMAAPFSLQARAVMEAGADGTKAASAAEPPRLIPHAGRTRTEFGAASWMLQPETMARPGFRTILFDGDGALTADMNRDGNFGFNSVYADSYRIAPLAAPAGYYLDSVRVGETDVAAAEVQLLPGTLPVTVAYKTGGGRARGAVAGSGRSPAGSSDYRQSGGNDHSGFVRHSRMRNVFFRRATFMGRLDRESGADRV
jgi:hypothetical protein